MLIIPEIKAVIILVPRTGSGSIKRAVLAKYPRAMLLYRHMEADGVPAGYDRWRRFGVCRHPVDRLWSMYKFLRAGGSSTSMHRRNRLMPTVEQPFNDWIIKNDTVFATGHDAEFIPGFHSLHMLPENHKSQFIYLRPDLGTRLIEFSRLHFFGHSILDVELPTTNTTDDHLPPKLTLEAAAHIRNVCAWEIEKFGYTI